MPFKLCPRLQGKGVGAGSRFAQRIGADHFGAMLRQVALFLFLVAPAQQGIVDQGVLHVDDHAGGGIDPRKLLHRQNASKNFAPPPPYCSGISMPIRPSWKKS